MAFGAHQKPTVGDYSHLGWILCDGSTLNVSDFQFLFNVIGYSFGGSGSQFVLPNPGGRVPGAIGTGSDQNRSTLTTVLGDSIGITTSNQLCLWEICLSIPAYLGMAYLNTS
jgi:microcystin-dependent protein